jgi:hypothetical protein
MGEHSMGLIRVRKIDYTTGGGDVLIDMEISTASSQITVPVHVEDQGSAGNNEREAFLELQKILEEALELVRHQLG